MEELIVFLEDMLSATPAKGDGKARRELMSSCLNQTRELLADLAVRHHDYGTVTIQDFRAQLLTWNIVSEYCSALFCHYEFCQQVQNRQAPVSRFCHIMAYYKSTYYNQYYDNILTKTG